MKRMIDIFLLSLLVISCNNEKKIHGYRNLEHIKMYNGSKNLSNISIMEDFGDPSFDVNGKMYYVSIHGKESWAKAFIPSRIEVCKVDNKVDCLNDLTFEVRK